MRRVVPRSLPHVVLYLLKYLRYPRQLRQYRLVHVHFAPRNLHEDKMTNISGNDLEVMLLFLRPLRAHQNVHLRSPAFLQPYAAIKEIGAEDGRITTVFTTHQMATQITLMYSTTHVPHFLAPAGQRDPRR